MNNIDLISIRFSNVRLPCHYLQKIEAGGNKNMFSIELLNNASGTKISTKGKNTIEKSVCRIYVFIVLTNPSPKRSKAAVKDYYPIGKCHKTFSVSMIPVQILMDFLKN